MDIWRISTYESLDGEGGRLYPGRWNSVGFPLVYLAASPPGALIEILVHLEMDDSNLPSTFTLLHVIAPDSLKIPLLETPSGLAWKTEDSITRKLGDAWLSSQRSALARVPSVILPETYNYLLNPLHPDASRIKIAKTHKSPYDPGSFANLLCNSHATPSHRDL